MQASAHVGTPLFEDYERARREFSWDAARATLPEVPGGRGFNIAHVAVDHHVAEGRGASVALRCIDENGTVTDTSYADLAIMTNRFANVLAGLGVGKGDRVVSLLGRQPEQYVAALGTLKRTAVFSPLFSSFGPEPIRERLLLSGARVLVTTPRLYTRKVAQLLPDLPALQHVLVVGGSPTPGTLDLGAELAAASPAYTIPVTDPQDMALLHFTSGTTGKPKGAVHVHEAVVAHHATSAFALDLHQDDISGAPPTPAGSPGRRTASSRR
ncbi:AMP-binding protein [Nocardioides sediminis]|uniref:AMP-binding protein n=1 Tax=Nocardioides sediminis TaxID=433648 RepID=UPI001900746F|nr:AMP-binding protein [Nocardioides sediminis]